MRPRNPYLLDRDNTVLIVVDLQEPFTRHIHSRDILLSNCLLLIKTAVLLSIPILVTVQYPDRMGSILPEIAAALPEGQDEPIDKLAFSCGASGSFLNKLNGLGREQLLICGVETHICVLQTALDLKHLDYQTHCAADAVSSRTLERHKLGMEKMRDCGVVPCASEGAVMELLATAGTPEFKAALQMIK